jgi:hypothetical protein
MAYRRHSGDRVVVQGDASFTRRNREIVTQSIGFDQCVTFTQFVSISIVKCVIKPLSVEFSFTFCVVKPLCKSVTIGEWIGLPVALK